jgi:hypothetical protein
VRSSGRYHSRPLIIYSLRGRSIEVLVGPDAVPFSVHEELVCASSAFFKGALSHNWAESQQRSVRLEEEEPDAFEIYLQWLYRGTLPVPKWDRITHKRRSAQADFLLLAKAYVLGDKLQDGDFADTVIDALVMANNDEVELIWGDTISYIFENTPDSSPARDFLVDALYCEHCRDTLGKEDDFPKNFLFRLAEMAVTYDRESYREEFDEACNGCRYHQHGKDAALCYRNRGRNGEKGNDKQKNSKA